MKTTASVASNVATAMKNEQKIHKEMIYRHILE